MVGGYVMGEQALSCDWGFYSGGKLQDCEPVAYPAFLRQIVLLPTAITTKQQTN